jgi:hypothetical protein
MAIPGAHPPSVVEEIIVARYLSIMVVISHIYTMPVKENRKKTIPVPFVYKCFSVGVLRNRKQSIIIRKANETCHK